MDSTPSSIKVPLAWIDVDDAPITLANSFVGQFQQEEIILTIGQLAPPMLFGNKEEQLGQAEKIAYVPVRTVSRLVLTRQRAVELIKILNETLAKYDTAHKGAKP